MVAHRRKTCPTNRGLRRKSDTHLASLFTRRKTCPTNRGLRHRPWGYPCMQMRRKTCPTNRGLRHRPWGYPCMQMRRKTCPTNRGLRLVNSYHTIWSFTGRKTCPTNRGLRHTGYFQFSVQATVGRLAPLIGD